MHEELDSSTREHAGLFTLLDADLVFLHIGYHEAGAKCLQERILPALETEVDRVSAPSCSYLAEAISYEPREFLAQLQAARVGTGNRKVFVSAETLSGRDDGNTMWNDVEIAHRLRVTFGEVGRIIAVVRNPLDYIMSLYVSRVMTRGLEHRGLSMYLRQNFEWALKRKLEYHRLLSEYVRLFGPDRVLILTYEELRHDDHGFLGKLCDFLRTEVSDVCVDGVSWDSHDRQFVEVQRIVEVQRKLNLPIAMFFGELRRRRWINQRAHERLESGWYILSRTCVQPALRKFFGSSADIKFPSDWKEYMEKVFKKSNGKLQKILDQDLKSLSWTL